MGLGCDLVILFFAVKWFWAHSPGYDVWRSQPTKHALLFARRGSTACHIAQMHVHQPEDQETEDLVGRRRQVLPETPTGVPLPLERITGRHREASRRGLPHRTAVRGLYHTGGAGARDGTVSVAERERCALLLLLSSSVEVVVVAAVSIVELAV